MVVKLKTLAVSDLRNLELDSWQKKVLNHEGDIALRCSRQSGKSTAVALKARKLAYDYPNSTILIMAPALRQSSLLYEKVRSVLELDNMEVIKEKLGDQTFTSVLNKNIAYREAGIFLDKEPTKSRIRLKNGSQILVEPCGETGAKIRGYTVDFMIVDEAQKIPDAVWVAVIPMMATSFKVRGTGWTIILGTPSAKHGYYYDCFGDKHFTHIHIPYTKCKRIGKAFIDRQRKKLSSDDFSREYLAEFVERIRQYFPSALIDSCVVEDIGNPDGKRFLGVDFARYGGDDNAYCESVIIGGKVFVVWADSQEGESVIAPMGFIKNRDNGKHYNRIFVDSGGLGGSILDMLQENISKSRVIGLDNSQRRFQEEGEEKKAGILKEDLYSNAKILMEQGRLKFIKNPNLVSGLKLVSFRYSEETGKVRISGAGKNNHIVEAFVRACWGVKNQGLKLWVETL